MGTTRASCTQIGEALLALGWQPKLKMREPKRRCAQHQKQIRMEALANRLATTERLRPSKQR